ncbi:MAG: CDGSH iron-sulfur domain-containing protein [Pseudomonadota bacterium]
MPDSIIVSSEPIAVDVEEGKSYFWCACGKSANQPFCDGSHKGTGIAPIKFDAEASKKVFFCACKQSSNGPLCDGSHSRL